MQTTDHRDEFVSRSYPIQEDMALQRHGARDRLADLAQRRPVADQAAVPRVRQIHGWRADADRRVRQISRATRPQVARRCTRHPRSGALHPGAGATGPGQIRHPREGRQDPSSPTNEPDLEAARPVASKLAPTKKPKPWRFPVGASLLAIRSPGDAEPVGRISERSEQSVGDAADAKPVDCFANAPYGCLLLEITTARLSAFLALPDPNLQATPFAPSEGRAQVSWKGSSGRDAARAARAMDSPLWRAPGTAPERGNPGKAGAGCRGKRFCLLFSRLKKVRRRARRNR